MSDNQTRLESARALLEAGLRGDYPIRDDARAALDELAGIDLTPDATTVGLLHEAWAYIEDLPHTDDWQLGWLERVRAWNAARNQAVRG